jgi:trigger factor
MKYTTTKPNPTSLVLNVTVDESDLTPLRKSALRKLSSQLKIAGFRPGKVPANVAERHLDPSAIASEVVELAVNQYYVDAIIKEDVQPLTQPKVDIKKFEPYTELEFTAEVEIIPEIKLADYDKIKKTAPKGAVTAEEVNEVIERLRQQFSEKVDVERAAKDGDEVTINFAGKDLDGKPVQGATGTDYPLRLGSKTFIDGFEENLVGLKKDDQKEFTLTFPKDYGHAPLANKKVTFAVTVKKVVEIKLPTLDDAFAKLASPFDTLKELKEDIKKELLKQKEYEATNKLKGELLDEIVAKSDVPMPAALIEDQARVVRQDLTQNLAYRGETLKDHLEHEKLTEEEWVAKEITPMAEKRVASGLVLAQVAKKEDVRVSEAELVAEIEAMKQRYTDPKMRTQLDTEDARRQIVNQLTTEKTLDTLYQKAIQTAAPKKTAK